jgi:hypothetical protein
MTESDSRRIEENLRLAGRNLPYPPTPRLAASVMARLSRPARPRILSGRWAWVLITVLILISTLVLVPPARAAILDFIQIGVVRIFRLQPAPNTNGTPGPGMPLTATPAGTFLPSSLDFAGETTLAEAKARLNFPILLPAYPPDLGPPDHVYLQNTGSPMLILVWLDHAATGQVRLALQAIAPGGWSIDKSKPRVVEETDVNGQRAVWTEGPYMVQIRNGNYQMTRLIEGHVLIWTQDTTTYRLETDLPLEEAIRIAESLEPMR